jgi:hypothetical protein
VQKESGWSGRHLIAAEGKISFTEEAHTHIPILTRVKENQAFGKTYISVAA